MRTAVLHDKLGLARLTRRTRSLPWAPSRDFPIGRRGYDPDAGVCIVLNTDAHGVDTLDNMAYAVATARRAWLTKAGVANTRTWSEFKKLLK